jgi:hypothetical protein
MIRGSVREGILFISEKYEILSTKFETNSKLANPKDKNVNSKKAKHLSLLQKHWIWFDRLTMDGKK